MLGFNPLYRAVLGLMGGPQAALSLDFLASFSLNPSVATFSRAGNATQFNELGQMVWAPMQGFSASHDPSLSPWGKDGTGTPITITGGQPDPNGGTSAHLVETFGISDSRLSQDLSTGKMTTGSSVTVSLWIKTVPGDPDGFVGYRYRQRDGNGVYGLYTVTSTWTRVSFTFGGVQGGFSPLIWLVHNASPGKTLDRCMIWRPMASVGDVVWPYIENTSTSSAVAVFGPRFDYNPETLAPRGLLFEAQRINSVRNSAQIGGVAGSPGTAPTNWSISSITGVTITTAYGVEDGIPYIDVTYSGTNTSGSNAFPTINIETGSAVSAANGQTWTHSLFARKVAGAIPIGNWLVDIRGRDAAQALITGQSATVALVDSARLSTGRQWATFTFTDPLVAFAQPRVTGGTLAAGASIDITLRFGGNQFEQGAFHTSLLPTFGTAATRAGDVSDLVSAPPYNPAGMTYYVEFERQGLPIGSTSEATSSVFYWGDTVDYVTARYGFGLPAQQFLDYGVGGAVQAALSQANGSANVVYKQASRVSANNARMAQNGALGTLDSTVTMASALGTTRYSVGRANSASAQQMHGWLRAIRVYTEALPDATLQALTS